MADTNVNTVGIKTMFAISVTIFALLMLTQFMTCWLQSSIRALETLRDKVHFDLILDQTAYEEFEDEDENDIEL